MDVKIAILRGINVGGNRKLLMADLKNMLAGLGLQNIHTYIQSGNVIFQSEKEADLLENELEKAIKINFNYDVPVIIRSFDKWKKVVEQNPFYENSTDLNKLHVTFLKTIPQKKEMDKMVEFNFPPDKFVIKNREVFIYCESKYHATKLSNQFFEKQLKVGATTRNWKTVVKLYELAQNQI